MINLSVITKALQVQLQGAPTTAKYLDRIERGTALNLDPAYTPWVGIYRGSISYEAKTLGRGANNWLGQIELKVVVQASGNADTGEAEDALEQAISNVLAAIETDRTIGGTVAIISGYNVSDYSYRADEEQSLDFQQAEIIIKAEVRS